MNTEETIPATRQPEQTTGELDRRKQEVNQALMQQALELDNPLQASLRIAMAELFEVAGQVKGSISKCFNVTTDSEEALKLAGPAFDQYLKCLRQADRFAHLDTQLRKPEK